MKSRKTRTLVALWLAAIGGFSLMFANADDSNNFKEIKMDITNAVQTIPQIIFKKTVSDSDEVILTNVGRLIKIDTKGKGFVLSRRWSSAAGSNSTVLGWEYNNIGGSNSNNSTIIWWSNNSINSSSNAVIWWWDYNSMSNSNYWTIAWWYKNSSNAEHATVVWGSNNNAGGEYSVVLWKESKANGKYSVSLWQYATVTKDSSFLWNDGTSNQTLDRANIFAVIGKSGMVVNMDKAHRFAQLTLWWSLFINQSASDLTWASSCARWTKWVVRVIPGPTDQVCFCSCDGESWNSLFGPWECNKKCGSLADPECDVSKLKKICTSEERYTYTGWCKQWDVVDGDGAYLVDREGNVHWSCQTNDGATKGCVAQIERSNIEWSCEKDVGEYKCNGVLSGYVVVSESDKGLAYNDDNNAKLYSTLSEAQSAVSAGVKCAYVCDEWLYKAWDECIRGKSCPRKTLTKDGARYTVPKMDHNSTTGVSYKNSAMECSGTVTCFDGEMTLEHTCRAYASCEEQDFGWYHVLATNNGQTRNVYKSSTTTHGSYTCERQVDCNDSKLSRTPGVSEKCDYKCDSGYVLDGYEVNHSLWNGVIYDVAKTISSASWDTYCNNRVQCSLWVLKLIWPRPEDKPECKLNPNWCSGTTIDWFKIDAMSHGESAQYYKSIEWLDGGCTTVAKCSYGKTTIWPVTCDFRCKGSEPELAIMWANKFTDKNYSPTAWTYVSNKTNPWACEWKCDQDWWYKVNSAETACVKEGYCEVMIRQGANMSWQYTTDNFKVSSLIWDSSFWCAYDDDGAVYSLESTCPEEVQRLNTTVGWIVMKAWYEFVKWTDLAGNTLSTNLNSINLNCGWSAYLRWKCADGYEYGWWKCRKSYACGQPKPTWNGILFWADKYLEWYTPSTWTYTNTSGALNACQYTCDTYYIWNSITKKCDPKTQDVSCGTAPNGSTWVKSTYKQTWDGGSWTPSIKPDNKCVTDSSSTEECTYKCSDGWKCKTGWGCEEESHASCKYVDGDPYKCEGSWNITITKTDTTSSTKWEWICKWEDDTTAKTCSLECDEWETLQWSSLHNGNCVNDEPDETILCCSSVPEHWKELPENEDVLDWSVSLCEPIIKENEEGSDEVLEVYGDCWYEWIGGSHTNGCWWSKYCCMDDLWWDGLSQITCNNLSENFCDDSIQWTIKSGKKYDKFTCEDGYHLEWCNCVSDNTKTPECGSANGTMRHTIPSGSMLCSGDSVASPVLPTDSGWEWSCSLAWSDVAAECSARKLVNITIKCDTDYYDWSEFVGGRVGGCSQIMWKSTTYTATSPVPTDIYIEQEKRQYGISSRDSNSCQFCFHPASTAVTPYIIRANQRTSTIQGGWWISTINRRWLNEWWIWFDSYLMNGDSSISFNGVANDYLGNISIVNHYLEYTGSNGVEYHITLADCDNVYENWINSTSTEYIKPAGQVCSRGSNPSDPNPGWWWGWWNSGGWSYTLEYYLNGSNVWIYAVDSNNRNVTLPESLNLVVLDGNGNTSPIEWFVWWSSYSHYILNGQYLRFDSWLDFGDPLLCADRYTPWSAGTNSACTINWNVYTMNKCQTAWANCINSNPL